LVKEHTKNSLKIMFSTRFSFTTCLLIPSENSYL